MTTLDELKELFSIGFLETRKAMQELKEEIAATSTALVSRLNALDAHIGIVEKQLDEEVEVTESQQGTLPMCTIVEDEMEKIDSEPAVVGAEIAEELNLQPLPEHVEALEDAQRFELCVETEDMPLAETFYDPFGVKTDDISSMENQTRHGFCAGDILENAAMPRTGPDKPEYHSVSQFDKILHYGIEDRIARSWSMSTKGNGFPWDDGISRELELVDDPRLDSMSLWVRNLLEPSLIVDQNKSRILIRDKRTTSGIPRSGPDIPSSHEFDQSQFLRFAGRGGCISYCDMIGSVTRPPEILHNVPILC